MRTRTWMVLVSILAGLALSGCVSEGNAIYRLFGL